MDRKVQECCVSFQFSQVRGAQRSSSAHYGQHIPSGHSRSSHHHPAGSLVMLHNQPQLTAVCDQEAVNNLLLLQSIKTYAHNQTTKGKIFILYLYLKKSTDNIHVIFFPILLTEQHLNDTI